MRRKAAATHQNGGGQRPGLEAGAAAFDAFVLPNGLLVRPLGKSAAVAAHTFGPVGNPASAAVPLVDAQAAMNAFLPQRPPSPMPGSGLGMVPPAMAGTSVTGGGDQLPGNSALKSTIQTKGPISATGDFGNPNAGQDVTKMAVSRATAQDSLPAFLYAAVRRATAKAAGAAGCTARHSPKTAELGRMSQLFGREFEPNGEDCRHCGVKFERAEDGKCNRCGRNYDTGKPWAEKKASGDMLAFQAWKATGLSDAEADREAGESLALPTKTDWGAKLKRLKARREIPEEKIAGVTVLT